MEKQYIVSQCYRISLREPETADNKNKVRPYKFTKDLLPGTYTQSDIENAVGKEFLENDTFKKFCDIGWIKVMQIKDITKSTTNFKKL